MSLTKLKPPNLDLQNWRYKFYKTTLKTGIFELSSTQRSLTSGALGSDDPTCQRKKTLDGGGLAHRRRGLRRHQGYLRALCDEGKRFVQVSWPKT